MQARQITSGPKHHFFGFHDLAISSRSSGRYVGLAVDRIDRPPMGEDAADVIVWDPDAPDFSPLVLGRTRNFNFPQGARQHWLGPEDTVIVNEVDSAGQPVAGLYDAGTGQRMGQISTSTYCTDAAGRMSYTTDFGRLNRLGGYGHSNVGDRTPEARAPADNGIFATEIAADRTELLLSIARVATAAGVDPDTSGNQFLTHLRLSPGGDRIAFLHRFRLSDGGEESCLWTVAPDGSGLRLLVRGFLSHFDWIGPDRLMIWGRRNQAVAALRRSPLMRNPLVRAVLPLIKAPLRALIGRSAAMSMTFLQVEDREGAEPQVFAADTLTNDGHPMLNPAFPDWLVTDTYPDPAGIRDLMLYNLSTGARIDLGQFRKLNEVPDAATIAEVSAFIRRDVAVQIEPDLYAFTRSGLHCDLHPRWSADGKVVAFDSIHEGSRQIYAVEVGRVL